MDMNKEEMIPVDLTVESLRNPMGIGVLRPKLSWKIQSSARGMLQGAYRIIVAGNDSDLSLETNLLWDSGKVLSDQSIHLEYQGRSVISRGRYVWKVMVWSSTGEASEWSRSASWEMGLLREEDWKAKWIEPEQTPVTPEETINLFVMFSGKYNNDPEVTDRLHPCQLLRRSFHANQEVVRARIYTTAHGIYHMELNGKRVGDREFAPEFTNYHKYLMVQTYDVTELLNAGDNAIGVVLADGWYAGRVSLTGSSCQYGDRLGLLTQLELEYADGSTEIISSDHTFRSSRGPWIYSDIFIGEKYDARLEQLGFSTADFNDSDWLPVHEASYSLNNLIADAGEPVRAVMTLDAHKVLVTPNGETIVDFGQVIAGRVRMTVSGSAGTEIVLEHSETLDQEGNYLFNINGRHKHQKDIYVLRGGEEETFEPKFTFHGFRYVKVTGYPGELTTDRFKAVVLASDLRQTGHFHCSDERINQLQNNIVWSQRGNMLSIPTDCPQRERQGYTGDFQVFAPTAALNMGMQSIISRWLDNLRLEQREDGQVPNTVPWNRSDREHDESLNVSSAGWGDAAVIVPWRMYEAYGDKSLLKASYSSMVKWVEYVITASADNIPNRLKDCEDPERLERQKYLWNTGFHFGDWLTPSLSMSLDGERVDMMKSAFQTSELVSTCFYAYSTSLLAKTAEILGYEEDAVRYRQLSDRVRQAFAEEYLHEDGSLKAHLQGIYVLALQHQMIPDNQRERLLDHLVGLIEGNGYRLDTGFMSIPFLMDVLSNNGRADVAYKLLYQTQCPSWLYEIEKGATTIWEAWNTIMPNGTVLPVSQNHYAFGCVGNWLYTHIAGIKAIEPAYKHFIIHPHQDCGMTWAEAYHECMYGTILSSWRKEGNIMTVDVTIPENTTAEIVLSGASIDQIQESGAALSVVPELAVSLHQGGLTIQAGSGKYQFKYFVN
ncbi:alpha-L-rhamnosidase [Paenibacillus cellulosilyticus]|uniref:alpha-L-rhamnosidase n=1 Tax=Paenibacillus cellulosilyticus TaxID=375489 RepID=A0A2V2YQU8_9BACL|nr:glycoside hydrolase family 78 protein [Paenibacillus cellulosilyticus]PWV99447.1 alpha-L-rhamnosidase [Paenibacillus cellulosilyticus]QKS44705.1 family 78 glycoside hydrolase catalytic domain [Paenibacillus cellulosilyticus]